MQFIQADLELLDRMSDHIQDELRHIGLEESVQAMPDAVIIQMFQIGLSQAQQIGREPFRPLPHTADGFPRQQDVPQQQQQTSRGGHRHAATFAGQVPCQELLQLHALQQLVHEWQTADGPPTSGASVRRPVHGTHGAWPAGWSVWKPCCVSFRHL